MAFGKERVIVILCSKDRSKQITALIESIGAKSNDEKTTGLYDFNFQHGHNLDEANAILDRLKTIHALIIEKDFSDTTESELRVIETAESLDHCRCNIIYVHQETDVDYIKKALKETKGRDIVFKLEDLQARVEEHLHDNPQYSRMRTDKERQGVEHIVTPVEMQ